MDVQLQTGLLQRLSVCELMCPEVDICGLSNQIFKNHDKFPIHFEQGMFDDRVSPPRVECMK